MIYVLFEGGTSEYGDGFKVNQFIFASKDKFIVEEKQKTLQEESDSINSMLSDETRDVATTLSPCLN